MQDQVRKSLSPCFFNYKLELFRDRFRKAIDIDDEFPDAGRAVLCMAETRRFFDPRPLGNRVGDKILPYNIPHPDRAYFFHMRAWKVLSLGRF